jgi:hypothetical protein
MNKNEEKALIAVILFMGAAVLSLSAIAINAMM